MIPNDTIVALATVPGQSAVAIVRLSGTESLSILTKIVRSENRIFTPREARVVYIKIGWEDSEKDKQTSQLMDQALVLFFKGPNSFTGEDCVELQLHGNQILVNKIIKQCLQYGARIARPGEFSERAFLNGKIDLTQAEALDDLIHSTTERMLVAASRSLSGEFNHKVNDINDRIISQSVEVEAHLDFSDEDIDLVSRETLTRNLNALTQDIDALTGRVNQGVVLGEGYHIALAGATNSGKSTLMNVLCGDRVSIVSQISGTTRDIIKDTINLCGVQVTLYDTAGVRPTDDSIEREGIRKAKNIYAKADRIVYLIPLTSDISSQGQAFSLVQNDILYQELVAQHKTVDLVFTMLDKADMVRANQPAAGAAKNNLSIGPKKAFFISALHNQGLDELLVSWEKVFASNQPANEFTARKRHSDCLRTCSVHLARAIKQLNEQEVDFALVAEELRLARRNIEELTGKVSSDDLLGKIFSSFCIGK